MRIKERPMDAGKIDKDALSSDGRKQGARAMINAIGGAVPFVGGLLSAGAGYWSEKEQEEVTNLLRQWIQMLEDELREKGKTIAEVVARIDMHEEKVKQRVESPEYQALLKKAFRNWSSVDTEYKRQRLRNILANAASAQRHQMMSSVYSSIGSISTQIFILRSSAKYIALLASRAAKFGKISRRRTCVKILPRLICTRC
jgi:hypothetical protein